MPKKKTAEDIARKISIERGVFIADDGAAKNKRQDKTTIDAKEADVLAKFAKENSKKGLRIFVAGGSRNGNSEVYQIEAYKLGRKIAEMGFKLDFGLSNKGIMGAVARGVFDVYNENGLLKDGGKSPITGVTTEVYLSYYENTDILDQIEDLIVAKTLEERKMMLLKADFIVFATGGLGTLDELAYDCVAMQDGMLPSKPFILFNIDGYFYHLMEFLKETSRKGFADRMPILVVDNTDEAEIAFEMLRDGTLKGLSMADLYNKVREVAYFLPYILKRRKLEGEESVKDILDDIRKTADKGGKKDRRAMRAEIEGAYLEKEIERMNIRLTRAARDVANQGSKMEHLLARRHDNRRNSEGLEPIYETLSEE